MTDFAPLAIAGARIIDGTGSPPLERGTIVIEGDRIVAMGSDVPVPHRAAVIEAAGWTVMPGLIDMHVHVLPYGERALDCWLGTGVTSVRDVGGEADEMIPLRDRVASGDLDGPRIFTYGPLLDWNPPRIALDTALGFIGRPHEDLDALAASVDSLIEAGVDGLKLYVGLRPDAVAHAIRQADGRVPVTGHLGRTWASEAIESGISCLEHLLLTVYQDIARPEDRHDRDGELYGDWRLTGWARADLNADYVDRFIESMVARRVALSPTTVLQTGGLDARPGDDVGEHYRERYVAERSRLAEQRLGHPPVVMTRAAPDPSLAAAALAQEFRFLEKLHRAGGIIVPSTDAGAVPTAPGFSLHRELLLLTEAGIPNHDVIQAATRVAAEVLGHDHELGTIAPGKLADVIAVEGDPLADITATGRIKKVVKAGRAFEPGDLLARART